MKYCIDIHGSQRMYSVDDTLTFRQVPPERQFFSLSNEIFICQVDGMAPHCIEFHVS